MNTTIRPKKLIILAALCWLMPAYAIAFPVSAASPEMLEVCKNEVTSSEAKKGLPKHLLRAISYAETGRWHKDMQEIIAWPWTVYSEGRGRYLPTKDAAIKEVRQLQAKGVTNIDVGCMQINLHFHPDAFDNLEDAFDPALNTQYAAELLSSLRTDSRSWNKAIAHYHSRTKKFNIPYKQKVLKFWRDARRKDTNARMAEARKQYRERQAHLEARKIEASNRRFTQSAQRQKAADDAS